MDNHLITNSHLLLLNISDIHSDQESDSDINSIDSDIEVDDTDCVSSDFIQLNLSNDDNSSDDEIEHLTRSVMDKEVICVDPAPFSSTSPASTTTPTATTPPSITTSIILA